MKIKTKQMLAKKWFIELQNMICNNVEHLEKTNDQLSIELEQKNLLIQNLTNGKIVLKEKNDSSIGFFQKVRNLLLPSG